MHRGNKNYRVLTYFAGFYWVVNMFRPGGLTNAVDYLIVVGIIILVMGVKNNWPEKQEGSTK